MGSICVKSMEPINDLKEIDFQSQFRNQLENSNGNYFPLLNYLRESDVECLTLLVKAFFHRQFKEQIYKFIRNHITEISQLKPPVHLLRLMYKKQNKNTNPQKIIIQSVEYYEKKQPNNSPQKDFDEIFSRSSILSRTRKQWQKTQKFQVQKAHTQLKKKEKQIEEQSKEIQEPLNHTQKVYQMQKSYKNQISRAVSFISQISRTNNCIPGSDNRINKMESNAKISFQSSSPNHKLIPQKLHEQLNSLDLRKDLSLRDNKFQLSMRQPSLKDVDNQFASENIDIDQSEAQKNRAIDMYIEIKEFYEVEIEKYKLTLEELRCHIKILEKQIEAQKDSKKFSSTMSKNSVNKTQNQRINSSQLSQQHKEFYQSKDLSVRIETVDEGTKMSIDEKQLNDSLTQKSDSSERKHAKSMLIRLFRDSKMFPIFYNQNSSPLEFVGIRQRIEEVFQTYFTPQIYQQNPIEQTNMIYFHEQRQYKRFNDYLRDYKSWMLIGKVDKSLYVGAFVNMIEGSQNSTNQSFLFSLPINGSPYILKALKNVNNPLEKQSYLNFGDNEFSIKAGSKKVNLNFGNLNFMYCELDGSQPNSSIFSHSGDSFELQQLEIHEVIFTKKMI